MKYYLIAGEASGDLHGSNLIRELKKTDSNAVFRAWGGDRMQEQGAELVVHNRHMAYMGFVEVLANIRTISKLLDKCKKDIREFNPDVVILIDYPGFNLRIAKYVKKIGIRVFYYISPQLWAWKRSRISQIKKWVDRMFVILPFEKEFYQRYGVDVEFQGHPLLDEISSFKQQTDSSLQEKYARKPVIAILPGSRKQEVIKMLSVMVKIIPFFPNYKFVVAGYGSLPESLYKDIIKGYDVDLVFNQTYPLLNIATAALVTSGTATLETALFKVVQVVCYKGNRISFEIAKRLVHVKYVSLVNLIMYRPVVKELIQQQLNISNLKFELDQILTNQELIQKIKDNYQELETRLGGTGASARVAQLMFRYLN